MQKNFFTIFLMAVMMCVSVCGCSNAPASQKTIPDAVEVNDENTVLDNIGTVILTKDVPKLRPEVKETDEADSDIEAETKIMYYTEDEVVMIAKLLQRECGGIPSDTEKACVAWTVCNRVDSDSFYGNTITEIVTARHQFAYYYDTPVSDELYELALDVLTRWNLERNGEVSVGRVLPKDYTYFAGDGVHNYFRNAYKGNYSIWDYSLPSPYES